jgi:hypothetical protein
MIVPPIWQTRYKGRITAKTFGTVFASSYQCNYHAKHGYYYYFIICYFGTLFATPLYRGYQTPHPGVWQDRQRHPVSLT